MPLFCCNGFGNRERSDWHTSHNCRPGLLLKEEFAGVPAAKAQLEELFPEKAIDSIVEEQPLLLIENVGQAIEELRR